LVGTAAFSNGKKPSNKTEEHAAATDLLLAQTWTPQLTVTGMFVCSPDSHHIITYQSHIIHPLYE
jgi:hypothetical protein